ncbi:MAG TPA: hypothetical protein PK239_18165 [Chitinophagales bacterium]|nr:hypothetical protein [Chitinophagales bacterium]
MKKCIFLIVGLLIGYCQFALTQPKYFANAVIWDGNYIQELRKVEYVSSNDVLLVGNIKSSFGTYWQNAYSYMDKYGNCTPIVTFANPSVGDLGNFSAYLNGNILLLVGLLTPEWDSTTSQAYIQHINISNNTNDIVYLTNYPSSIREIYPCIDGGYLLVGRITPEYPSSPQTFQMYAVKLNHQFDIEWERIYNDMGFSYDNYLTDIMPAPDGSGYYLLGTVKWGANADIILLHIDHYGNPLNHHLFNINGMDQSLRFIPTPDGSLLISGGVQGELNISKGVVLKVNEQGEIKWVNQLFSATDIVGYIGPLLIAPDGNYVGAGAQRIVGSPKKNDVYIVKLAAETGAILWQRHYGGNKYEYCYDMIATTDGGYLMVGRQDTTLGALAYLIKTNCMGLLSEPQADFTFSTNANNLSATFYNQSQYVYPDSIDGGHYIWHFGDGTPPLQTQSSAPITHNYPEEGAYYTALYAIVCQDTSIFEAVVKPQSGWGTAVGIPQTPPFFEGGQGGEQVVVYPNPAQNTLHFTLQNTLTPPAGWSVSLFTPAGQRVLHSVVSPVGTPATAGVGTPATASIQIGHLPVGMYFYTVEWGGVVLARGKVAVVR